MPLPKPNTYIYIDRYRSAYDANTSQVSEQEEKLKFIIPDNVKYQSSAINHYAQSNM